MPVEQILQAVIEIRHHDEYPRALAGIVDPPFHLLGGGDRLEFLPQPPQIDPLARYTAKRDAHEEALRDRIVELVHLDEVEAPGGQETRDRRGGPHAVRATRGQHIGMIGRKPHSPAPRAMSGCAKRDSACCRAVIQMGRRLARTRHGRAKISMR